MIAKSLLRYCISDLSACSNKTHAYRKLRSASGSQSGGKKDNLSPSYPRSYLTSTFQLSGCHFACDYLSTAMDVW